jgi:holo-[acyl-carrier protein] synthase
VGVDVVSVSTVAASWSRFGTAYLARVFTDHEVDVCGGSEPDVSRLAARFAAKEAVVKVLRPLDEPVNLRQVEIVTEPGGWCEVQLHAGVARIAEREGLEQISVSMSHEGDTAVAMAMGTFAPRAGGAS